MKLSTFDAFKHAKQNSETVEVVGSRLLALQNVLTTVLKDIVLACEESGVLYTLSGGSCLGAVRHHGFIPWDDDLDVNILHGDFSKFVEALKHLYPGKYTVQVPGKTPGYDLAFPRIRLNGTIIRTRDDFDTPSGESGVYVDVFYLENTPDNALLRKLHGAVSMGIGLLYSCRRFAAYANQYKALLDHDAEALKAFFIKERLGKLVSFWTTDEWTKAWDDWNSRCRNRNSRFLTIPVGRKHYFGELQPRNVFFPAFEGIFGDLRPAIPGDANAYLTKLFGPDYMTPPSEEDRETHVVYEFDLGEYGSSKNPTDCKKEADE